MNTKKIREMIAEAPQVEAQTGRTSEIRSYSETAIRGIFAAPDPESFVSILLVLGVILFSATQA